MYNTIPYSPSRLDSTLYFYKFLRKFKNKKKLNILDVGSGKLYLYEILNDLGVGGIYLGIDVDPKPLRNKNKKLETKILKQDFLKAKIDKKYDLVASLWVLEHLKKDEEALIKMTKMINKDGVILIAVPSIWSWPFEFGKHGYRYYTKSGFTKFCDKNHIQIKEIYCAGGILGFIFMILYSWPRYIILILGLPIYMIKKLFGYKISWQTFAHSLIYNTWYLYHRFPLGIKLHNLIVQIIVKIDNYFKIFPASYIFVLKK